MCRWSERSSRHRPLAIIVLRVIVESSHTNVSKRECFNNLIAIARERREKRQKIAKQRQQ